MFSTTSTPHELPTGWIFDQIEEGSGVNAIGHINRSQLLVLLSR